MYDSSYTLEGFFSGTSGYCIIVCFDYMYNSFYTVEAFFIHFDFNFKLLFAIV
jgi:hypothetical protein